VIRTPSKQKDTESSQTPPVAFIGILLKIRFVFSL